jgi:hypothetical protein
MRIGFDLDNTIFDYSEAIVSAVNQIFSNSIHSNGILGKSRESIKTNIKSFFGETEWTRFQGLLYTKYVNLAKIDPCALYLIQELETFGTHQIEIVSHKTIYPILGPRIDMRSVATNYFHLTCNALLGKTLEFPIVYFHSLEEKINYINSQPFDIFVDDLWEVIGNLNIHHKIWFRPDKPLLGDFLVASSWKEVEKHIRKVLENEL